MIAYDPPRLLLLDCDGVLIRSERANVAYYNHIFQAVGEPVVEESDRHLVGLLHTLSTPQVLERFVPEEKRAQALGCAEKVDYARFVPYLEAEPGWSEVLGRWRTRGKIAVATNRGWSARSVLEAVGLLPYLDLVVTSRDVPRPKPHPDVLLKALDHFQLAPQFALYVGDSALDEEAARRAGIPFLGFRRTDTPSASSPEEVGELLERVAGGDGSVILSPSKSETREPKRREP